MFYDLDTDPWQPLNGMPRDWDESTSLWQQQMDNIRYRDCLWLGLFEPPMMRFYSEAAIKMILEEQSRYAEQQRIRAQRLPEMVDDVAAQWERP